MKKTNILTACGFAAIAALLFVTHFEPFFNALALFYSFALVCYNISKREQLKDEMK